MKYAKKTRTTRYGELIASVPQSTPISPSQPIRIRFSVQQGFSIRALVVKGRATVCALTKGCSLLIDDCRLPIENVVQKQTCGNLLMGNLPDFFVPRPAAPEFQEVQEAYGRPNHCSVRARRNLASQ